MLIMQVISTFWSVGREAMADADLWLQVISHPISVLNSLTLIDTGRNRSNPNPNPNPNPDSNPKAPPGSGKPISEPWGTDDRASGGLSRAHTDPDLDPDPNPDPDPD